MIFAPEWRSLSDISSTGFDCLNFRRILTGANLDMWEKLGSMCSGITLSDQLDTLKWLLDSTGFSVNYYGMLK